MNKSTIGTLIVSLTLIIGLGAAIALVRTSKDYKSSATFADASISLLPAPINNGQPKTVGQEFTLSLTVDGGGDRKIDGIQTLICYDHPKVGPISNRIITAPGKEVIYSEIEDYNGSRCLRLAVATKASEKEITSGVLEIAKVTFVAEQPGEGKIILIPDKTVISAENPGQLDKELRVTNIAPTTYKIVGAACPVEVGCPTQCGQPATEVADGKCGKKSCSATPVCVGVKTLDFKTTFQGVKQSNGCANDMQVNVIVLKKDGNKKAYENIVLKRNGEVTSNGDAVYLGSVPLTDLSLPIDGASIFVKGPKHLQVKYGVDNQNSFYNKSGGELSISADLNDKKVFNFSSYPILAGDVSGNTESQQDGTVDGRDFNYVKTRSISRETVGAGGNMIADLDGNCFMNAMDVTTLMLTLGEKQAQLY